MGGYPDLHEWGQEAPNIVHYTREGDEYHMHCDGECRNADSYRKGRRIASSFLYCKVAEEGGATLFTRSGIKVVPKARDFLFFGYKLDGDSCAACRHRTRPSPHSTARPQPSVALGGGCRWGMTSEFFRPTRMDRGLTEHSGCPVRKGDKWLLAQWYREGTRPRDEEQDHDWRNVGI